MLSPSRGVYLNLLRKEIKKYNKNFIVKDTSRIVTGVKAEDYKKWGPPAIFSQLVNSNTSELVEDFIVQGDERSIHFVNIVSPGWTSALAFTQDIAAKIDLKGL